MNVPKLRTSTAIERALEIAAVSTAPKKSTNDGAGILEVRPEKAAKNLPPDDLTADNVSLYLQGISADSCDGIDALVSGLNGLRERLVTEGDRIKQDVLEFAGLNRSVIELTKIVSEGVIHVQAPGTAR